jgi:hypothetical protein
MRTLALAVALAALAGCDLPKPQKKSTATPPPATEGIGAAGGTATSPAATTPPPQSSTSGNQTPRSAAKRVATMNDLTQIRIFIENASLASGKMPSVNETYAAVKQAAPTIAQLIDEKVITLHAATNREQVWAYETAAYQVGGMVVTSSGVERMTAAQLQQRLKQ